MIDEAAMSKALFDLDFSHPYFTRIFVNKAKHFYFDGPPPGAPPGFTLASDANNNLYINRRAPFSREELTVALLHEAQHFFLGHFETTPGFISKASGDFPNLGRRQLHTIANKGQDLSINQTPTIAVKTASMNILDIRQYDFPAGKPWPWYAWEIAKKEQERQQEQEEQKQDKSPQEKTEGRDPGSEGRDPGSDQAPGASSPENAKADPTTGDGRDAKPGEAPQSRPDGSKGVGPGSNETEKPESGSGAGPEQEDSDHRHGPGHGQCGSVATGVPEPWETGPTMSETDRQVARENIAQDMVKFEQKNRGSIPANQLRVANDILSRARISWESVLRSALERECSKSLRGKMDPTFMRVRRIGPSVNGYQAALPTYRGRVPRIVIIEDTSASRNADELGIGQVEAREIVKRITGAPCVHISCDTSAHKSAVGFSKKNGPKLVGGGGTDMRQGLDMALSHKPAPTALVLFTDGVIPPLSWPENAPLVPLVVVVINDDKSLEVTLPPHAQVIRATEAEYLKAGPLKDSREFDYDGGR